MFACLGEIALLLGFVTCVLCGTALLVLLIRRLK